MDLPDLIPNLRRAGREYHGPCPYCDAGKDRLVVTPDASDGKALFWCRRCGTGGDAIKYLRDHKGMAYPEACEVLGVDPADAPTRYHELTKSIEEKREKKRYKDMLELVLLQKHMTPTEDAVARECGRVFGSATPDKIGAAERFLKLHLDDVRSRLRREEIDWKENSQSQEITND